MSDELGIMKGVRGSIGGVEGVVMEYWIYGVMEGRLPLKQEATLVRVGVV